MKRAPKRKIRRRVLPAIERDWELEALLWLWQSARPRTADVPAKLAGPKTVWKR